MKTKYIVILCLGASLCARAEETLPELEAPQSQTKTCNMNVLLQRYSKDVVDEVRSRSQLTPTARYSLIHGLARLKARSIDRDNYAVIAGQISSQVKKQLNLHF